MGTREKLRSAFRKAVSWSTTILDWWGRLTALQQLVVAVLTAIPVGGLTLSVPVALPTNLVEWFQFFAASLLIGLGMLSLGRFLLRSLRQLTAERKFQRLPQDHKIHLWKMAQSGDLWRTSRTKGLYVDLSQKGLIRDELALASNQAMVGLTPTGKMLAQEWGSGQADDRRDQDAELVQDLRTIWKRHGVPAVSQMLGLFRDVHQATENSLYWSGLLEREINLLETSIDSFETSMSEGQPIEDVRDRFNKMYGRYIDALEWLLKMRANEDLPQLSEERPFSERLEWWEDRHALFHFRLKDLVSNPKHSQTLHVFYVEAAHMHAMKPRLVRYLRQVEDEANYPRLTQLESDT